MKSNALLGRFITFILLMGLPKNRAVASGNRMHPQPKTADLLPLTRFLKATLERVQEREILQARQACTCSARLQDRHTGVRLRRKGESE